ncbi:hypothetical protein FHS31_000028 [Sphingomonas vulcanisoli]|uniref:DUF454 family protein n=1 Tax=Sphingomonas vulcanisoli TaxID=1658060 RepID=A0ABX0TS56_9SPHN|nr:hypothetical protein [Sphingomonas vulcanisoli]NIJ06446.1 hypothetical protein [Sphingomonas vulcanisoli]
MDRPYRLVWLALGWLLILLTPVVGILPGPGGVFVFAGGLVLLLRNSAWIKRRYASLTRRYPKLGRLSDKALRRGRAPRGRIAKAPAAD